MERALIVSIDYEGSSLEQWIRVRVSRRRETATTGRAIAHFPFEENWA